MPNFKSPTIHSYRKNTTGNVQMICTRPVTARNKEFKWFRVKRKTMAKDNTPNAMSLYNASYTNSTVNVSPPYTTRNPSGYHEIPNIRITSKKVSQTFSISFTSMRKTEKKEKVYIPAPPNSHHGHSAIDVSSLPVSWSFSGHPTAHRRCFAPRCRSKFEMLGCTVLKTRPIRCVLASTFLCGLMKENVSPVFCVWLF